jgi:hypothetical protein
VLLIDSRRAARAALPVLKRGSEDRGAVVGARRAALLTGVRTPNSQSAARHGEELVFTGAALTAGALLRMSSLAADPPAAQELAGLVAGGGTELAVRLPVLPAAPGALGDWAPGFYRAAVVERPADGPVIVRNEVVFALAPTVILGAASATAGDTLTLSCSPRIRPGQRVLVLFGERQLVPAGVSNPLPADPAFASTPTSVDFIVPAAPAGKHLVRLRVDGVDSIPVIYAGTPPLPEFDPAQQVTL